MIRLHNVHMHYPVRSGRREILRGISFELGRGEKLGIFGRNGAGKSTLIRLISGAEFPTAGTIERTMSVSWPLAFGGAFQGSLTGRDNVRFISRIYAADFETNMQSVEEFAELGRYLDEPVKSYSSGMRARLAFALSMIIEFDCFLIDEVSAVGDLRFREKCEYELFEKRADRSMIIVSHEINYIKHHCSKFAILNDGQIQFCDTFDESYEKYVDLMAFI